MYRFRGIIEFKLEQTSMQEDSEQQRLVDRPQTSMVGQRKLVDVFNAEIITQFKSQTDLLQKNLIVVNQISSLLYKHKSSAGSSDESSATFLAQQVTVHQPLFKQQTAVEQVQRINRTLQTLTMSEINEVFDEYDLCLTLVQNLGSVVAKMLEIDTDAVASMFACSKQVKSENIKPVIQTMRFCMQTLHHSLEFVKAIGLIFEYLFLDSYRYEQIFKLFVANKQLMKSAIVIVTQHLKFNSLARCYSKNKQEAMSHVPLVFVKILYKLLTNQFDDARTVFLAQNGIITLKQLLNAFRETPATYEMYLYCLGMVPALLTLSNNYNEDFIDAGYISLLSRHLISFYEEDGSSYIGMVTPLLLALKALVTSSPEMKEELKVNMTLINVLYQAVSSSFGNQSHTAHLHLSGTILMCELGHDVLNSVIRDRLAEMQTTLAQAEENRKVHYKEQINRVMEWAVQFSLDHESYVKSTEAIQTIKSNVFDDDLIERSLVNLRLLWTKNPKSRQLIQVEFGYIDTIINCFKNADEGILLNTCQALEVLLTPCQERKAETFETLIDVIVRHGGLALLDTQIRTEGNLDIKKASLKVITKILASESKGLKEAIQDEVKRLKIVNFCSNQIEKFPEDEVDEDVIISCLEIVASASNGSKSLTKFVAESGTLDKIAVQLSVVLEEFNGRKVPSQAEILKLHLSMFDKLVLAVTKVCIDYQQARKVILKVNLFAPLLIYLSRAVDLLGTEAFYSEERIMAVLQLLSQATDGERTSQNWILNNVKIDQICAQLLQQTHSLLIAGQASLFISQLSGGNPLAQHTFSTDDFARRLVYLLDFNELVNSSDPDTPVETLQEISFYALLAIISIARENQAAQDTFAKHGVIQAILKQLRSGSYEPKKTACFCLSTLVSSNDLNKSESIQLGVVTILVEMISDEEDDVLSEKAYECLEILGPEVVVKLLNKVAQICEERKPYMWNSQKTIILDVYGKIERHVYAKKLNQEEVPIPRMFGPQDQDDLINQVQFSQLQKILPILNGLLFDNIVNCQQILNSANLLKAIFGVFGLQFPIDMHENALYACANLIQCASQNQKTSIVQTGILNPLLKFLVDIANLEFTCLKQARKIYVVDYGIMINPNFAGHDGVPQASQNRELSINEIRATVFDMTMYEIDGQRRTMSLIAKGESPQIMPAEQRQRIVSEESPGVMLDIEKVIRHLQELRAASYSVLNELLLGNGVLAENFVNTKFSALPGLLVRDVCILPYILDLAESKNDQSCSEALNQESFELMANLMSMAELRGLFENAGASIEKLEDLKQSVQDCELGLDNRKLVGQLTQIIREMQEAKQSAKI